MKRYENKLLHEEKIEYALKSFKKELIEDAIAFGYGQADAIVRNLAMICGVNLNKMGKEGYRNILSIYTEIWASQNVIPTKRENAIISLITKRSDMFVNVETAELAYEYCVISLFEPRRIFQNAHELKQKIAENQKIAEFMFQNKKEDYSYGMSADNPVCVDSIFNEKQYLESLMTEKGEALHWLCVDASMLRFGKEQFPVPIDKYHLYLHGQLYKMIYICPATQFCDRAPEGMIYRPGYRNDNKFKGNLEKEAEDNGMTTDQFLAYVSVTWKKFNPQKEEESKEAETPASKPKAKGEKASSKEEKKKTEGAKKEEAKKEEPKADPWSAYKIMDPLDISMDELFANVSYVEENKDYLFYSYHSKKDKASGYYLVRVAKRKPNEALFFGEKSTWNRIFHDDLFCINKKSSVFSDLVLTQINVRTGAVTEHTFFGKGRVIETFGQDSVHEICQDSIDNMYIEGDRLVLNVHRKKGRIPDGIMEGYNADLDYRIELFYEKGELKHKSSFSESSRTEETGLRGRRDFRDNNAETIELDEKYDLICDAVEQIIADRKKAGYPAGASYQIAYFILYLNILKEIPIVTERESTLLLNKYRLNGDRQMSSGGAAATRIIENAYSKIRRETDRAHAIERFAFYIEHILSKKEALSDKMVNDRIKIVIKNVKNTLSSLIDDLDTDFPVAAIEESESEAAAAPPARESERKADAGKKPANKKAANKKAGGKQEELNEEEKLYNLLKQNVKKYAENPNRPTAQEFLASTVITYASAGPRDDSNLFSASEVSYCETIVYTTFYVLCHILNRSTDKDLRTSDMDVFFNIIIKEIAGSTSFINSDEMLALWKDRWAFYNSLMDQSGDLYKYLSESSNAFSVFLLYDKNHYLAYRDRIVTAESIIQSFELQGYSESIQEQISIDSYIYSLDSVLESAMRDVLEEF